MIPCDRPVEVTKEMVEAGADVIERWLLEPSRRFEYIRIAEEIFLEIDRKSVV
jgi:hypothetical protein